MNAGLILLNVLVFSNAFAGVKILAGGALSAVVGFVVIAFSAIVFVRVNIIGFLGRFSVRYSQKKDEGEADTLELCEARLKAFAANNDSGFFNEGIDAAISQIEKFRLKMDAVQKALAELFEVTELTYKKFSTTVSSAEAVIIGKTKALEGRLHVLDAVGYTENRRPLYDELAGFISETVKNCDEINLKMDKLLLELAKFSASGSEGLEQNSAVAELQSLIDSVKWYRGRYSD